MRSSDPRIERLRRLARAALTAPPGARRKAAALAMGCTCHLLFGAAILAMIHGMYFGLSHAHGSLAFPAAWAVNAALVLQFPLAHSLLLTRRGQSLMQAVVPGPYGGTVSTTTYAIVASLQLLALFLLWTPSEVIWWKADGAALYAVSGLYALAWIFLGRAIIDAGVELQSGALGWLSMYASVPPRFPDLPTLGLFRFMRHPIYLAFACTLWTVPTWTPDQLLLALTWTAYCIFAPLLKERRQRQRFGERFDYYRRQVPYMLPRLIRGESTEEGV